MTMPAPTAQVRSLETVTTVTTMITKKSKNLGNIRNSTKPHQKVFSAASAERPMGAPMGTCASSGPRPRRLRPSTRPQARPEARLAPPLPTLMIEGIRTAPPPWRPRSEARTLPAPWPRHSRRMELPSAIIWSRSDCVIRLSRRPATAKRSAVIATLIHIFWLTQFTPAGGKSQAGAWTSRPPAGLRAQEPATCSRVLRAHTGSQILLKTKLRMTAARGAGKRLSGAGSRDQVQARTMATQAVTLTLQKWPWTYVPSPL
mmetsp:Transcript_81899/g.231810  ORF Transcript_81899/g.231810 Transcript_81899/m.231810 type:complete len:259 (-) Transcript_81899:181-957(-)